MHFRFPPKLQQQCHASPPVDQGISGFPSRLSLVAFPRGFSTWLSHVLQWCESILGLKVEAVQVKQFSLEWTETHGGLWEWWHDPGVPLVFCVETVLEPEDSSPVLTWILGYLRSVPTGVSPRLK